MADFFPSLVVKSLAGHDKGALYHIISLEAGYALLTDGRIRPFNNPKRKKLKHLLPLGNSLSPAALELKTGSAATNREIIKSLAAFKAGRAFDEGGK